MAKKQKDRPLVGVARRLLQVPRYIRLPLTAALALVVALVSFALVGWLVWLTGYVRRDADLYLTFLYELSRPLSLAIWLFAVVMGLGFYALGWWLYVGPANDRPPARAALAGWWLAGVVALFAGVVWVLLGLRQGTI